MFEEISKSFLAEAFKTAVAGPWLIGLLVVIAVILSLMIILSIRARRYKYTPYGSIFDEKQIRRILRMTFDQRRTLELQINSLDDTKRPTFRCSPEYVGSTTLTLEVSGIKKLSDRWLNRNIRVFFRVKLDDKFTYFTFDSTIESITYPREDLCHIGITIPTVLDNRQKRSFLRLAPPPDLLLGAAIWHGQSMPAQQHLSDLSLWPLPSLLLLPRKNNDFEILDLSAGGMRISIPREVVKNKELEFATVEQILILIDLMDPEQTKRLRCWIQCRIQNVWEEHTSKDIHMGLQFLAWARPKEAVNAKSPSELEWLRLSNSLEVETIGNWIMRRHLELYREDPNHTSLE